jgi:hypothetical protein
MTWPPPKEIRNTKAGLKMRDIPSSVRITFEDAAPEATVAKKQLHEKPHHATALGLLIEARNKSEGLTMPQLCQRSGITKSTLTNLMGELKKAGLVHVIGGTPFLGRNRKPWPIYSATKKARL